MAAQIPAPVTTGEPIYQAKGQLDQPFLVEVLDAHRTVGDTLLVRLAVTNQGSAALHVQYEFAGAETPAEARSLSGVYAIDPNGEKKLMVLHDAQGHTVCSRLDPDLQPGERRTAFAQLAAPPDTTSAVSVVFPRAGRIANVPVGLPEAGEAVPTEAAIGDPGAYPPAVAPAPPAPGSANDGAAPNTMPEVTTNQISALAPGSVRKGVGTIQSANSSVPFTVEVLGFKRGANGKMTLQLALTNNGSGPLEAAGQFTSGLADTADAQKISGVYVVDPVTHARADVVRTGESAAACSAINSALRPGERRMLQAQFPELPAGVKTVYVYFPHAAPISGVMVMQ